MTNQGHTDKTISARKKSMNFQGKNQEAPERRDAGGVLSTMASLILLSGLVWLVVSILAGCTPYF